MFKRRTAANERYRYFFATDIHGSDRCFRKFLAAVGTYGADALILGGDIAGKAVVPIVRAGSEYTYAFNGPVVTMSDDGLEAVLGQIRFNGLYPYICDRDEHARLVEEPAHLDAVFRDQITAQVRGWLRLAEERLDPHVQCVITPGNDDPLWMDPILAESSRVACPERRLAELGPLVLASLGSTNRTPWDTDREFDEPALAGQIDAIMRSRTLDAPIMFNFHCPPYDSGLDTVNQLDEELRPVVVRGAPVEIPVGSTAVRAAIERYQPVVALHGHIHESLGVRRIGQTVCINPGSEYGSGFLKGALVDVDDRGRYVNHLLTSG